MSEPTRYVRATDGVRLAVYERPANGDGGDPGPTVLAVHGYPDDHGVWDAVSAVVAHRYRVVTYDVRGAGASQAPAHRDGYRMPQLVGDLATVLDEISPRDPVHLLAHDWGSLQVWAALGDDRLAGRIASYTSISGPSLAYGGAWLRRLREHPRAGLRQLAHSYYIALFLVPGLAELGVRHGVLDRLVRGASRARVAPARPRETQLAGLELYRANIGARTPVATAVPDELPVQLVVPERDPFVTPDFAIGAATPWVATLSVRRVSGGHWVPADDPDTVAELVTTFVAANTRS